MYWLNEQSRKFLSAGYLLEGETAEQRIADIGLAAEKILKIDGFAAKFVDYMGRGWISLASPIWSNFGRKRGLPISCNGSYFDDRMDDILLKVAEIGAQTKNGAGTSAYLGALRASGSPIAGGGYSYGPTHFAQLIESHVNVISQSNVRRGNCAVYLDVEHPDIYKFLEFRDDEHPIQKLEFGVCVSDQWLNDMPNDKEKRKLWTKIIEKRFETGMPYLFFTDTVNRNAPDVYRDKGRKIFQSNLCSEIALANSVDESFVCDLSSLNILHYDEWKDSDLVETMIFFLDAVMEEYIVKTAGNLLLQTVHNFAKRQRALGLGVLGWHSYLQSKMIAFESFEAFALNEEIWQLIQKKSLSASKQLAEMFGEPEMLVGYGRRNVTVNAIAPTTSSSFILGQVSPSIEPLESNYFIKDLAKGKFTYKNPYLKALLKEKKLNTPEVWKSILLRGGSVQHIEGLTDHEKKVFKTFGETSQLDIINQAADRQKYIDQSQSLNLKIHPATPLKDVNQLLLHAWKSGVKTLYYQRGVNPAQEMVRDLLTCSSCEG